MLKTNSKKARENIRGYILNNFTPENYTENPPQDFPGVAAFILDTFRSEKPAIGGYARMTESERFTDWASGLPSVLDTCYYYNRSAVNDLGAILEETESEKARFDEPQAESLLTSLIYRELVRGVQVMRKYGQREIKALIRSGAAVDITGHDNAARQELEAREGYLDKVGYSSGVYGLNGGLLKGHKSGTLYAITARTTALFIYF